MFSKYANPMILLDGMIRTGRFSEFVNEFITIHNKEQDEKTTWEFYLHRVFDMSYKDFVESLPTEAEQEPQPEVIAEAVVNSAEMLKSFHPCQSPVNI